MAKPIKLFEITDVVLKDPTSDVGASNRRHLVALHGGITSGKQWAPWMHVVTRIHHVRFFPQISGLARQHAVAVLRVMPWRAL
jgi:hypothetical protein